MANRDILALGTSAGGVEALVFLARNFSPGFPASVLVTLHIPSHVRSTLDEILSAAGPLPAAFARDREPMKRGHIYIAPPDRHLLVEGHYLRLGHGPRENNTRPAIDPMLRSAAMCCGGRTIGAVLTGTLGDGASGLWAVDQCGGITVVQDPRTAAFADMPANALSRIKPDHVLELAEMPALFERLAREPAGEPFSVPDSIVFDVGIAKGHQGTMDDLDRLGRRSVLACPDCHGVMWEIDEGGLVRYRCHVGHAYSAEMLGVALDENLIRALGSAIRALEERVALAAKLEAESRRSGHRLLAESWSRKLHEAQKELETIREAAVRLDRLAQEELRKRA